MQEPNAQTATRVVLGVTGGIAAYKSAELVRRLRERGAEVRVVMSLGAQRFVTPLTFQAVSGNPVHTELLDAEAESGMGHIELARWADVVVVAPATAHFMAKLTHGGADDLLSTLCLATVAPVFLAPAMNQAMWAHPATADNLETLERRGVRMLGPGVGNQACGDEGPGRMLEPADIADQVLERTQGALAGRQVLVTAGPTFEDIDPVRFIGNRSSGKMGFAVAEACRLAGANVTLISGPVHLATPEGVDRIDVRGAREMAECVAEHLTGCDLFIGVAAVADWTVAEAAPRKLKKHEGAPVLALEPAPDIIAQVAESTPRPYIVGFAAETDDVDANARRKRERKGLDIIAANRVGTPGIGFGSDDNEIVLIADDGDVELGRGGKRQLARRLVEEVAARMGKGSAS